MTNPFIALADLWISRWAEPRAEALAAVAGLAPAVVVTGGSRGIGRAIAARFAAAGRNVVLVARKADALESAASAIATASGVRVVALALDVTASTTPEQLETRLREAGLYADVLVNNAGLGLSGPFLAQRADDLETLLAVNVAAATRLMRHAVAPMAARGRGGILNVASLGGFVPGPHQAAYYASKAFVLSLTEAVAYEMRGRGVRIAALAPGPVETRFHRAMGADGMLYRYVLPTLAAETVAASAYRHFMLGRRVIVPGLLPTLAAVALRLLPHGITVPIVGALLSDIFRRNAR